MKTRYTFLGDLDAETKKRVAVRLGSHGLVQPGEPVDLSPAEAACIKGDSRFKLVGEAPKGAPVDEAKARLEELNAMKVGDLRALGTKLGISHAHRADARTLVAAIVKAEADAKAASPAKETDGQAKA
jgi:hypothetical protein